VEFYNRICVRYVDNMIAQVTVQMTPAGTCALPEGAQQMVTAGGDSSLVLPKDCFVVPSKNGSMYGKKMKDIDMEDLLVENNRLDDRVIRFRKSDNKMVMPDMLWVLGRYTSYKIAHRAVLKLVTSNDDKVTGLTSLEIDTTLFDMVMHPYIHHDIHHDIQSWMTIKKTDFSAQHEFLEPIYLYVYVVTQIYRRTI